MRAFILAGLLAACGGATVGGDELGSLEFDRDSQFATVGQDISVKSRPGFSYGTDAALNECSQFSATQVCLVPAKKATVFTFVGVSTGDFKTGMRNAMLAVAQASGQNFTFTEGTAATTFLEIGPDQGNTFCNTANNNDVTTYYLVGQAGQQSILNQPAGQIVPGTYKRRSSNSIHLTICQNKISARGANAQEDLNIQSHVMKHAILEIVGIGARSDVASAGFASNRSITPIVGRTTATSGESCAMASYDTTISSIFFLSGACPAS